jgi:hypothetical protein
MATVLQVGDNPQQPFALFETYVPDQLIAGNLKLVSDVGLISGSAVLPRGSVMGMTRFGSLSASAGKAFATGTITIAALPANGDTLTVNGTVINFVTAPSNEIETILPPATQFIQATTALQAAALAEYLNASTDANISAMTYSLSSETITVTANVIGTAGNAYTLATSDSSAFTLSAATLAGGTANTGTATVGSMSAGPAVKPGDYIVTLTSTGSTASFSVTSPSGDALPAGAIGTAYKNAELNFTITTGGTPTTGDEFIIQAVPGSQVYKLCVASATDGSEIPAAILVDTTDPTGGNVMGGVYLMGQFNANALVFDPSLTLAGIKSAFLGRGIFIKTSVSADDPM